MPPLLALGGCGAAPTAGPFNNIPGHEAALAEHQRAWPDAIGSRADAARVRAVVTRAGGSCSAMAAGQVVCGMNVAPRWPSIFTTRIMWVVELAPGRDGTLRLERMERRALGMDL